MATTMMTRRNARFDIAQFIRIPTFSDEAERAVLGGMICSPKVIKDIRARLSVADFYIERNARLFAVIMQLYRDKGTIDLVILKEYLKLRPQLDIDIDYVLSITADNFSATNALMYAQFLRGYTRLRRFIDAVNDCVEQINKGQVSASLRELRDDLNRILGEN